MTQKFKVGDRVRILDVGKIYGAGRGGYLSGDIAGVVHICADGSPCIRCKVNPKYSPLIVIDPDEIDFIELVDVKLKKKQRIEALEKEVAELKERVEALEQAEKQRHVIGIDVTANTDDVITFEGKQYRKVDRKAKHNDIVIFREKSQSWMKDTSLNKPYIVNKSRKYTDDVGSDLYPFFCDVYEPLEAETKASKTPNLDIDLSDLPKETYIKHEGKLYKKVNRIAKEGDVVVFNNVGHVSKYTKDGQPYKVYERGSTLHYDDGRDLGNMVYGWEALCPNPEVYELVEQPKTPNQQRKEIIEKAKEFVKDGKYSLEIGSYTRVKFIVNPEKRTVVALIRGVLSGNVREKGIAKCMKDDVFNVHIGKAIALGRALGKDVSEFENAVKPTEIVVGMYVEDTLMGYGTGKVNAIKPSGFCDAHRGYTVENGGWCFLDRAKILDDTNAEYEVEK